MHVVGVKMADAAPPRARKAKKSAHFLLFAFFKKFNFEMENFLKVNDETESDKS